MVVLKAESSPPSSLDPNTTAKSRRTSDGKLRGDDEPTVASAAGSSLTSARSIRTDHLGFPLRTHTRPKLKYARTYTIMYDAGKDQDGYEEKEWTLLKDAKNVMDTSLSGLTSLYTTFCAAVPNSEQSQVGPRTFRLVLAKHGVRDFILMSRLFNLFCELPDRLDYRKFVKALCSVNDEPVEDRIGLLWVARVSTSE